MSSGAPSAPPAPSVGAAEDAGRVWTPQALLAWTENYFRAKGIPTPRLDGELLLAHALGLRRLDLYLQFDRPLTAPELARYRELVRRRAERVPVAYLTGEVGFWDLTLEIAPGCLIPRPDTETLVEAVLGAMAELRAASAVDAAVDPAAEGAVDSAASPPRLTVLELGAGSGAIPLAVCSATEGLTWIAVERSAEALAVARRNRLRHAALLAPRGNRLWLVHGDGFAALRVEPVDLIVSNPPYIRGANLPTLMPEVALAEPRLALDGGADGLAFHRLLIAEAARRLRPGGRLLLEIGHDQLPALQGVLAETAGLEAAGARRDLAGHVRVLDVRKSA